MNPKIILCLALVLSGVLAGCSPTAQPPATATAKPSQIQKQVESLPDLKTVLTNLESSVPEFGSIGMSTGIPSSGQTWQVEEYARAGFVLRKNPRSNPPGTFPRETTPVPIVDLYITITRYASAGEVQKYIKNSLFGIARSVSPEPKEEYKGAILYRYSSGFGQLVCQSGLYIVEINPNCEGAMPLTMKVLDIVLAELDSTSSKSR